VASVHESQDGHGWRATAKCSDGDCSPELGTMKLRPDRELSVIEVRQRDETRWPSKFEKLQEGSSSDVQYRVLLFR
jgi:hypothetical protein